MQNTNYNSAFAWGLISNLFSSGFIVLFELLTNIMIVRLLSVSDYGIFSSFWYIFSILVSFVGLGSYISIPKFFPELRSYSKNKLVKILVLVQFLQLFVLALLILVTFIIFPFFYSSFVDIRVILLLFNFIFGFTTFSQLWSGYLQFEYRQNFINLSLVFFGGLKVLLLVSFFFTPTVDLFLILVVLLLINALRFLVLVFKSYFLLRNDNTFNDKGLDKKFYTRFVNFSLSVMFLTFFSTIISLQSDSFILIFSHNFMDISYYNFAFQFAKQISTFSSYIIGPFGFIICSEAYLSGKEKLATVSRFLIKLNYVIGFPILIISIILSNQLISTFYGSKMLPGNNYFIILLFFMIVLSISNIFGLILWTIEDLKFLIWVNVVFGILRFLFSYIFISFFGLTGSLFSFILINTAFAIIVFIKIAKFLGNILPVKQIGKHFISGLIIVLLSIVLNLFFAHFNNLLKIFLYSFLMGSLYFITFINLNGFEQEELNIVKNLKIIGPIFFKIHSKIKFINKK